MTSKQSSGTVRMYLINIVVDSNLFKEDIAEILIYVFTTHIFSGFFSSRVTRVCAVQAGSVGTDNLALRYPPFCIFYLEALRFQCFASTSE